MASLIMTFGETPDEKCQACGTPVVLVTTSQWEKHYGDDDPPDDDDGWAEPKGETSGHLCPECNVLTAVFIHTPSEGAK